MPHYPLRTILLDTVDVLVGEFGKLCILAWKPFAIFLAATFVFGFIERYFGIRWLVPIGGEMADVITGALFVLAVHRYRLLGWSFETKRVPLRIRVRELRFLGFLATFSFCASASSIREFLLFELHMIDDTGIISDALFSDPVLFATLILPFATLLVAPLLLLALPAIALDHPHPLSIGWRLGRRSYWKLFGVVLFIGIPTVLVSRYVAPNVPLVPFQILIEIVLAYVPPAAGAIALCFVYQEYSESTDTTRAIAQPSPDPS